MARRKGGSRTKPDAGGREHHPQPTEVLSHPHLSSTELLLNQTAVGV